MPTKKLNLPPDFDPYDMKYKKQINPAADDLNFVIFRTGAYVLGCGARRRGRSGICGRIAGTGTDHPGVGRCVNHAGTSTGPNTPEGKAISATNATKHGLYAKLLLPEELEIFKTMVAQEKPDSLEMEINLLKTKILSYIRKYKLKAQKALELAKLEGCTNEQAIEKMDEAIKIWASTLVEVEGEDGRPVQEARSTHYYHAATVEDRALDRALNTLGRLVEKHARINGESAQNELESINAQLRAASNGIVTISWGGQAPARKAGGENG
jgi:hypothetical protein